MHAHATIIVIIQNVLKQGPDFWCWFDKTQFSCHCIHAIHACKDVLNPNVTIIFIYTFQSNCAEGLHFSAFHVIVFLYVFLCILSCIISL